MRIRTLLPALALAVLSTVGLTACGSQDAASNPDAPLRIGVSPTPHAQILRYVADNLAKEKGLKIEVKEIDDYNIPNTELINGGLDANYFQHQPYLAQFEKKNPGARLQWITGVHLEPLGVYSRKAHKLDELPDGATVAVSNDPANQARALTLVASSGLITLRPGAGQDATERDITANPKHLKFAPQDPAQLPRSLEDVDASVINGNYAIAAHLQPSKDALLLEKAEHNPYVNGLVTKPELAKDKRVLELAALLDSPQVHDYITKTFDGSVLPTAGS